MNPPKSEQELERLAIEATDYGLKNHKQECPACGECFSYSHLAEAYSAGFKAHRLETELLRKDLEEAKEIIHDEFCGSSHHPFCININAALSDDKASEGRV
jgi:hypothetical protein